MSATGYTGRLRSRPSSRLAAQVATAVTILTLTGLFAPLQGAAAAPSAAPAAAPAQGSSSTSTSSTSTSGTSSTSATSGPAPSSLGTDQAKVATLELQISGENQKLAIADELYNQSVVRLHQDQATLTSTDAALARAKSELAAGHAKLQADALRYYMLGSAGTTVPSIFDPPSNRSDAAATYTGIAVGNVNHDLAAVRNESRALQASKTRVLSDEHAVNSAVTREAASRQVVADAVTASEATLASVKGRLAQEVALQAAQQAEQAAAEAAAARAAQSAAAAEEAAAQAAAAAQVASSLGSGSAATDATNAANQAAGSAGTTPVTGVGSSGSSTPAGLIAVHAAMQFLGVPYVWGGSSMAGVDCSGLTMEAWAQAGVSLLHSAALQYADSPHVSLSDLEPGDLLFYDFNGTGIDHVVMYVGPTIDGKATPYGAGTIIQAAETGTVVSFDPLWYYGLVGAARP